MGKKSKIYKSGLPRNQIKKQNKQINKIQNNQQINIKQDNIISEPLKNSNIKYIPMINYNIDALKKANETLGLSQDQINSLYKHPLRNRRYVNNLTLTKREKKRELRKMKKELKQQMEDKTKLDITLNPNLHFRNTIEQELNSNNKIKKEKNKINKTTLGFNFEEMNGLINDMVEDDENKIYKENIKNKSSIRNKNQRNLIYNETNEINNILNNKEFIENPNITLKTRIQEQQKIKERNEKIKEEFNQKYNLLNLK